MLKGYVHGGLMDKATLLFHEICSNDYVEVNVRTLNTFLRGCQWSATTVTSINGDKVVVTGGISSSEYAWELVKKDNTVYDVSSYEYTINILTQSLQISKAIERLQDMDSALQNESCYYESYAFCYYYIIRGLFSKILYGTSKKKKCDRKLFKEYSRRASEYVDKAIGYYRGLSSTNYNDNVSGGE